MKKGKLIVLEGLDRSGKSSLTKSVKEFLLEKEMPTVEMNFPDRTSAIGKLISDYLSNKTDISN
jgi:dTMP kinase